MAKQIQTVIIVTAYGEDNYYQKQYEDIVGIYTSVANAIKGAKADGMTKKQKDYLDRLNAFWMLDNAMQNNDGECTFQVDYDESSTSSYMFRTYNLD